MFFATASLFSSPVNAATGINKQINFQGKVINSDGTNVTDGTYSFTFKLYSVSSAGSAIWTETKSLAVVDGIFRTDLGDTTALPGSVDFNTDNIYLGINFNTDGEMSPRVRLDAVPQAFNADKLSGLGSTSFLRSDTSNSFSSGTLTFNDSTVLALGTSNNLQMTFNGTNSSLTSATGNLTINNTNTTGSTIAKLGTTTSATSFQIQNSSGTPLFTVDGAGTGTLSGLATAGIVTNTSSGVLGTLAGTSTTVLHGNASGLPTYGAIALTTDVSGTLPVANGGTGQTTYTDGQLLIGNTTGNTLTKATITGTANQVVVTNGNGSITLSTPQDIATSSSPTFTGETIQNNANADSTQLLIDNTNSLGGSGLRINRTSNVRTAQIQLSTGGTTDWWFGLLRRGGSASQTFAIGRGADINTTTPLMNIATSGLVGWGVLTPTYNMSFEGTVAKTIGIERNTISNTAGVSWNLSAGAATSGAADKDGGTAALTGGVSTGAGVSRVTFSVSPGVAASTSDNTITEIARLTGQGMNFLFGTTTVPTGATYNHVLGGGSTSPVLGAATTDLVSLAAVDKAAGDRRLYIQSESGSAISLGNDRLNFAAATGIISVAGTDTGTWGANGLQVSPRMGIGVAPSGSASALLNVGGNPTNFTSANYINVTDATNGGALVLSKDSTNYSIIQYSAASSAFTFATVEAGTAYTQTFGAKAGNLLVGGLVAPSGATKNLVLEGGTTSPVLGAATTDMVSLAAVDNAAADRRLYIQSESGSAISLGNDRLNFAASTGNVSIGGTDVMTMTSSLMTWTAAANPQIRVSSTGVGSTALFQIRNDAQIWQFVTDGSDSNRLKIRDGSSVNALAVTTGYNFQLLGGSTSPTLASAAADTISLAAVDAAAGDRRLYIQSESGSAISLGNDRLNFGASTGSISVGGTDELSLTSSTVSTPANFQTSGYISLLNSQASYPSFTNPTIYSANGTGVYPFDDAGKLVLQSRSSGVARDIVFVTGTTPSVKMVVAAGGNVGIGDTSPASLLTVGSSDAFQVNSSGAIAAATGITSSGTITLSGLATAGIVTNTSSGVLGTLAGTSTTVLHGNASGLPTYGAVVLTTDVSGTLPVGNGGTGTATAFTAGSVIFAGASGVYSQNNTRLFWDNTNGRLGIGTASPQDALEIDDTSPTLRLANGNSTTSYFQLQDTAVGRARLIKTVASGSGGATIDIDPIPLDLTSNSTFRFFRLVTTSGFVGFQVFKGDGTATANAQITGNGDSYVVADNGNFGIGQTAIPTGATRNIIIGGGATSPVLGAARQDTVSLAAVDKAAGDRRLYIQSESGSAISLGNDRLNFAASTGYLTVAGTDLLALTANTAALTSANTTGATTSASLALNANSLTSGTGLYAASSTLTSGILADLQVSGTAAAASQTALNILTAGANGTVAITTYGAQISNTHTNATSGTNVALYLNASGATTANYGLIVNAGNVGIGTTTPSQLFTVQKASTYNSENTAGIGITTGADAQPELIFGTDNTNTVSYIQSLSKATSYGTVPLSLQPNGGNIIIGAIVAGSSATSNLVLGGGATTPILGAATADLVSLAAVDKAAGDRRLYIQSESGSAISLGNDRLNFAASTGNVSTGGTDLVQFSAGLVKVVYPTLGNDTSTAPFQVAGGADVTLGPLLTALGVHPSATGSSRYGYISAGDNAAMRTFVLNFNGSSAFGNVTVGTTSVGTSATQNFVIGGPATSPVLGAATADLVSLAAVDKAAGDRRLYIQSESGSAISLGNDRLNFAGTTNYLSTGGTDLVSLATDAVTIAASGGVGSKSYLSVGNPSGSQNTDKLLVLNTATIGAGSYFIYAVPSTAGGSFTVRGDGQVAMTSTVSTGVTTGASLALNNNSLTTGTGLYAASSTLQSGKLVDLQVSGTAAAASQTALNILTAGATATNAITTYGAQISNTHSNATSGTNVALLLSASGATTANYGLVVTNGNSGFGNAAPAQKVDVTGTIRQSNAVNCALTTNASGDINCTSDERLKDLHGYYDGGLMQLDQVNPIRFSYKNEQYLHVGFSAQNIASVLPEGAPIQNTGFYGLDSNAVLALTVNSVKQLDTKTTGIQTTATATQADIVNLQSQITNIIASITAQAGDALSSSELVKLLAQNLNFTGNIAFAKDVNISGGLIADAISINKTLVVSGASNFKGEVTLSDKQAGFAKILKYASSVDVKFTTELVNTPVIQVTPQGNSASYWVDTVTTKGFTLHVSTPPSQDTQYSWIAITSLDPKTTVSEPGVSPAPIVTPTPLVETSTPTPSPSTALIPAPTASDTPTPDPVVSPT